MNLVFALLLGPPSSVSLPSRSLKLSSNGLQDEARSDHSHSSEGGSADAED